MVRVPELTSAVAEELGRSRARYGLIRQKVQCTEYLENSVKKYINDVSQNKGIHAKVHGCYWLAAKGPYSLIKRILG